MNKKLKYSGIAFILFLFLSALFTNLTSRDLLPVPGLGNSRENIRRLDSMQNNSYKFMVIGDTQYGVPTAKKLFQLSKSYPFNFGVYLGDLVIKPYPEYYKFFLNEYSSWDVAIPMFVVPGNHDIAKSPIGEKTFLNMFGSLETYFVFGKDLFILLNNANDENDLAGKDYSWLENVLKENYKDKRYIFLFMHKPSAWEYNTGQRREDSDPTFATLHNLVKKYNVNYIFSGHIHNFRSENRDGHMYIVSGNGGSGFKLENGFYHFIEMNVSDDILGYKLIKSDRGYSLSTEFKRVIITQIAPFF